VARRLILDTGALVSIERAGSPLAFAPDDDVAVAAITAAELLTGVELADPSRRQAREDFVTTILVVVPVLEYDLDVARSYARLLAHTRRQGKPRGAHDLIIAATASATARSLVSHDAKAAFTDLPGVRVIEL
jgi:tRNA(fMet)-specific endonuclease VapC